MSGNDKTRQERLAAALRENLRRRKSQSRQMDNSGNEAAGEAAQKRHDKS